MCMIKILIFLLLCFVVTHLSISQVCQESNFQHIYIYICINIFLLFFDVCNFDMYVLCMHVVWVFWKVLFFLFFFFFFQWRPGHVSIFSFILTDTRNVIRTLCSRCSLDKGREYFLGVLLLVLLAPFCIAPFCNFEPQTFKISKKLRNFLFYSHTVLFCYF